MDLTGKAALVTGGAKRIGRAVALALAQRGCHVVIHYGRSAAEATQTVAEIAALGGQAWSVSADLSDETAVNGLTPLALEKAGRLDILINNAAIFPAEDFLSATSTSWDRALMINLKAPFLLSQAFARALPAGQPGKIINLRILNPNGGSRSLRKDRALGLIVIIAAEVPSKSAAYHVLSQPENTGNPAAMTVAT